MAPTTIRLSFLKSAGAPRIGYSTPRRPMEEFQVNTSNYSAEYGRSAGGVVNTVTKSGTNCIPWRSSTTIDRDNDWGAANEFTQLNVPRLLRWRSLQAKFQADRQTGQMGFWRWRSHQKGQALLVPGLSTGSIATSPEPPSQAIANVFFGEPTTAATISSPWPHGWALHRAGTDHLRNELNGLDKHAGPGSP